MARKAAVIESVDCPDTKKPARGGKLQKGVGKDTTRQAQPIGGRRPPPKVPAGRRHPEVPPRKRPRLNPPSPKQELQPEQEQALPEAAPVPRVVTQAEAFQELVRRASQENEHCLRGLREILDQQPEIWQKVGDVSALAERAWVDLLSAGNKLLDESIPRRLKGLKSDLAGPSPTPLESLLIDYLGVTWLAAQQGEIAAAQAGGSPEVARLRLRRAESAQKRFTGAVKTLSLVRALLPGGLRARGQ